jgi:hypothetical protein
MKKFIKIAVLILLLIILGVGLFVATFTPKQYSDFDVFAGLKQWTVEQFEHRQMQTRPVTASFDDFSVPLSFPFTKLFGGKALGVPLKSYENEQISAATVSMFEIPPGSGYHSVFTLNILPRYAFKAPVLHVDFLKPAPGTSGMFILDFFNVDKDAISYEEFFGDDLETITRAMATVEQYQRPEDQGRGELSRYLDPYKSPYRLELQEPKSEDEAVRRAYYTAARDALMLVLPVYLQRIAGLEPDPTFAPLHEEHMRTLVRKLHTNDFAVAMGRRIFKEHFHTYWIEAFWNVEIDLDE